MTDSYKTLGESVTAQKVAIIETHAGEKIAVISGRLGAALNPDGSETWTLDGREFIRFSPPVFRIEQEDSNYKFVATQRYQTFD